MWKRNFPPVASSNKLPALPYLQPFSNSIITDTACISFKVVLGLDSCSCRVLDKIASVSFCSCSWCTGWWSLPAAPQLGNTDLPLAHTSHRQADHLPLPKQSQWEAPGPCSARPGDLHPPAGASPDCCRPWSQNSVSYFLQNLTGKQKSCRWKEIHHIPTRHETALTASAMTSQCKVNN